MSVCIVDSSVVCELLSVPGKSRPEGHDAALYEFKKKSNANEQLLIPIPVILEVGNHIARCRDGQERRRTAELFRQFVLSALKGASPFTPTYAPDTAELARWIDDFPEYAMRGVSLGDRGVVATWERQREIHRETRRRVYVWTLDAHLAGYDTRTQ